jgi:hypothetical protein
VWLLFCIKEELRRFEFEVFVGLATPVLSDPFLDILFVTELRDALELERLRFSLELVGRLFIPFFGTGDVGLVGLLRLEVELDPLMLTFDGRTFFLSFIVEVDLRVDLGEFVPNSVDLWRDLVDEFMLG